MSLIDEALKRARLEAAQRAAQGEGLPYPTIPRHLAPPHRRRRWLAPAAVALAVIAGLVVGLLMASRAGSRPERLAAAGVGTEPVTSGPATPAEVERDPPADTPDPAEPPGDAASGPPISESVISEPAPIEQAALEAPPAARPVTSGPSGPAELERDPVAAPEAPETAPDKSATEPRGTGRRPQALPPTGAPTRQTAPPPEPPPAASTVTDPDSGVLLVLPGRPEPEAAAEDAQPEPELPIESHVQRFPLPGGNAIELGGIAWSETGPFALINGRVVGPGSAIGDYTLERIQQDHVELVGNGRRVHLSLQ